MQAPPDWITIVAFAMLAAPFLAVLQWAWKRGTGHDEKHVRRSTVAATDAIAEAAREILTQANQTAVEIRTTAEAAVTSGTVTSDQIAKLDSKLDQVNTQLAAMPALLAAHDAARDRSWRPSRSDWLLFVLSLLLGMLGSFVLGILTALAVD